MTAGSTERRREWRHQRTRPLISAARYLGVGGGGGEGQLVPLPAQLPAHLFPLVGGLFYTLLENGNILSCRMKILLVSLF
jgi:hypothetical protein